MLSTQRPFLRNGIAIYPVGFRSTGYNIYARSDDNLQCEEIEYNIKRNKLRPCLIDKQVKFLYGQGPFGYYRKVSDDGKIVREW